MTTSGSLAVELLRQHASGLAEHVNGNDPEAVHQARVATRRLRAVLRVFSDVLPAEILELPPELQWFTKQAGPLRDIDVQLARLRCNVITLGLSEAVIPYETWLQDQRQRAA